MKFLQKLLCRIKNGVSEVPIEDSVLTPTENIDYDEVIKHHKKYTNLLGIYVNTTRINLYIKIALKVAFFIFTIYVWYMMVSIFIDSFELALNIIKNSNTETDYMETTVNLLVALIPSLISLITSFIVIPQVIAQYLYNTKEEDSMIKIIGGLQTYDNELYKNRYIKETQAHEKYESASDCSNDDANSEDDIIDDTNNEGETPDGVA